jgi:hypothetical protein
MLAYSYMRRQEFNIHRRPQSCWYKGNIMNFCFRVITDVDHLLVVCLAWFYQPQGIELGFGCVYTVVYELGHAIGFYHKYNRPDRNDINYI